LNPPKLPRGASVWVGVFVLVAVLVGVFVLVAVLVLVAVAVAVFVTVLVEVGVGAHGLWLRLNCPDHPL
jgi:hypothetical protein